jgi:hypothetical protein
MYRWLRLGLRVDDGGMPTGPWWAALTTWVVVNLVNVTQAIGFASRKRHGMVVNHALGLVIAGLAVPATAALMGYAHTGSRDCCRFS